MISALEKKITVNFNEDTLTSSVFDYLLLLPNEILLKILYKSLYENTLPIFIGEVEYYEFWPKWNPENTSNSKYVEPDIFMRFQTIDVIIEAKRREIGQQYRKQWENELYAYYNEFGEENKTVYLFAIGGVDYEDVDNITIQVNNEVKNIKIIKCRWYTILTTIMEIINDIEKCSYISSNKTILAILKAITKLLEMHGYIKMSWLSSICDKKYSISYSKSSKVLERRF